MIAISTQSADAQILLFQLEGLAGSGLLPGNEVPNAANSTASGDALSILFNPATRELSIEVDWGSAKGFDDLTGDATAMHIHGPADINSAGGILYNLSSLGGFDASAIRGGFSATVTIASADVPTLLAGKTYLNIHTADNRGGELRGNLVQAAPEPTSMTNLGLLGAVGFLRRR